MGYKLRSDEKTLAILCAIEAEKCENYALNEMRDVQDQGLIVFYDNGWKLTVFGRALLSDRSTNHPHGANAHYPNSNLADRSLAMTVYSFAAAHFGSLRKNVNS